MCVADAPLIVQVSVGPIANSSELGLLPIPENEAVDFRTDPMRCRTKGQLATHYIVSLETTSTPLEFDIAGAQTYNPTSQCARIVSNWHADQVTKGSTLEGDPRQNQTADLAGDSDGERDVNDRDSLPGQTNPALGNLADRKALYRGTSSIAVTISVREFGALLLIVLGAMMMLQSQRGYRATQFYDTTSIVSTIPKVRRLAD